MPFYLGVYSAISGAQVLCTLTSQFLLKRLSVGAGLGRGGRGGLVRCICAALACPHLVSTSAPQIVASDSLHGNMLRRLLRAPMSFFNTTPMGRIVNRRAHAAWWLWWLPGSGAVARSREPPNMNPPTASTDAAPQADQGHLRGGSQPGRLCCLLLARAAAARVHGGHGDLRLALPCSNRGGLRSLSRTGHPAKQARTTSPLCSRRPQVVLVGALNPYTLWSLTPILLFFYFLYAYFQSTVREVKRLDAITRSPIYTGVGEAINGIASIRREAEGGGGGGRARGGGHRASVLGQPRCLNTPCPPCQHPGACPLPSPHACRAYGAEARLLQRNAEMLDSNVGLSLVNQSANRCERLCMRRGQRGGYPSQRAALPPTPEHTPRWLSVRLESLGALAAFGAAVLAVEQRGAAAVLGNILSSALQLTQLVSMTVRAASLAENSFNSGARRAQATWCQDAARHLRRPWQCRLIRPFDSPTCSTPCTPPPPPPYTHTRSGAGGGVLSHPPGGGAGGAGLCAAGVAPAWSPPV